VNVKYKNILFRDLKESGMK